MNLFAFTFVIVLHHSLTAVATEDRKDSESVSLEQIFGEDASRMKDCGNGCVRFRLDQYNITSPAVKAVLYVYDHSDALNSSSDEERHLQVHRVNVHGRPHHLVASKDMAEDEYMGQWKTVNLTEAFNAWITKGLKYVTLKMHFRDDVLNYRFQIEANSNPFILVATKSRSDIMHHQNKRSVSAENDQRSTGMCEERNVEQGCCLKDFTIDLREAGPDFSWITHPRQLHVKYCTGTCSIFRLSTLAKLLRGVSTIHSACCHPSSYSPRRIQFGNAEMGDLHFASASSCTCV